MNRSESTNEAMNFWKRWFMNPRGEVVLIEIFHDDYIKNNENLYKKCVEERENNPELWKGKDLAQIAVLFGWTFIKKLNNEVLIVLGQGIYSSKIEYIIESLENDVDNETNVWIYNFNLTREATATVGEIREMGTPTFHRTP